MTDRDIISTGETYCTQCGARVYPDSEYCTRCGAKQHTAAKTVAPPANKWFTQAGSLDDSLDGEYLSSKPAPVAAEPAPIAIEHEPGAKDPVESHTTDTAGATFIKPVKGLKVTPVHREPEPVEPIGVDPISADPTPVTPVEPVKEAPKCRKCGAVVPKGTTLCWKCSTAASVADKTAAKKEKTDIGVSIGSFFAKNKKPILIGFAACLVLIVGIILVSMGGPLSESQIIAVLPESITSIYVDDALIPLNVDSLKIDRRKTKDGMDEVYCIIELSSDTLAVTKYQHLTFVEYDGNEWILDGCVSYVAEEIRVLKAPDTLYDLAIRRIEYSDERYADIKNYIVKSDITVSDQGVRYVFDINKTIGIMSITGQIVFDSTLDGDEDEGYQWSGWPDDSAIQITWDVAGTWNGGMSNWGMGWYEFTMNIDSLINEAIVCTWSYDDDGDVFSGDGADCWISDSDAEKIEVCARYSDELASYVKITFYTDGTCVANRIFLGDFYLERQ